jgi:hypothetical protein
MRRLTFATLSAALVLSACSEQSRDNPTEPRSVTPPSAVVAAVSCVTPFPNLTSQFTAVFAAPTGSAVIKSAQDKLAAIKAQCGKGKVADAQAKAFFFVDWMFKKYGGRQIPSATPVELATFMSSLFVAVGLQLGEIDPAIFGPHGGAGVFEHGFAFDLKNGDGTAAIHLDGTAFDELTLITIIRLPDSDQLVTNGEQQFPPFYDYNAANESGNHTVKGFAIIGFCVNPHDLDNPQIGHNPIGGGFEVLEAASAAEYAALGLTCTVQDNEVITLNFGEGLQELAVSAWHTAGHYAGPVAEAVFLPQPLHATTLNPGGIGGRLTTLSPVGEVEATYDFTVQNVANDPGDENFAVGEPLDTCNGDSCFPEFEVSNGDGTESTTINATLIPLDGSTGTLSGITSVPTSGEGNTAVFSNLRVSASGTYFLIFAAPNAEPYRTGTFTVEPAPPPIE